MFSLAFKDSLYIMIKRNHTEVALLESVLAFSWFWDTVYSYAGEACFGVFPSLLSISFFFLLTILSACLLCFWWGFWKHNISCGNGFPSYGLRYCGRFTALSCCVSYQNGRDLWQDVIDVSEPLDQDGVSTSLIFCCQKINPSCNFSLLQHFAVLGDSRKGCLLILVIFLCP